VFWPALAAGGPITLNGLECTLDEQSGTLLRLAHPATRTVLETSLEMAGLLKITYLGKMLEPKGSTAKLIRNRDGMEVSWEELGGPLPDGGRAGATVRFKAAPDCQSVIVSCHVRNGGRATISQVLFPDLQGLRPIDEPHAMELRMAFGAVNPFACPVRPAGRARYYPPFIWQRFPFEPVLLRRALSRQPGAGLPSG
jgi:hypothetical protein